MNGIRPVYVVEQTQYHRVAVRSVADVLRRGGCHPVVMDNPDPVLMQAARGIARVRIGVPDDEVERAVEVLRQWEQAQLPAIDSAGRAFSRQLLISFVIAAVATGLIVLGTGSWQFAGTGLLIWLAALVTLGVVERAREEDRKE